MRKSLIWFGCSILNNCFVRCSLGYTEKAVVSARAARKKRWICAILALIIVIIIVVVVVVVVNNATGK